MNVVQPKVQVPDIAAQVSYAMRQMGVAPIPRNYELFYEAYIGSNPRLTKDLASLGSRAKLRKNWTPSARSISASTRRRPSRARMAALSTSWRIFSRSSRKSRAR